MGESVRFAPARLRRAFFVFAGLCAATGAVAGPPTATPPPPLAQVGKPNEAESARILDLFRRSGWMGYLEFDLRALPKRGDEVVYSSRLWGGLNEQGAITRVEVTDANKKTHRFLLQNGERAAVWRVADGQVSQLGGEALFTPLIPGVEVTPFDLQMPFLYWPGAVVERVARVRGRPAYVFLFAPPPAFSERYSKLKRVRAYFDAQFNVPIQIELLGASEVLKTMSLVDLKKVGEQWIPKSFDIRNEATRDKTRFQVTAAALNLEFPPSVFAPARLDQPVPPPPPDKIVRIEP